MDKEPVPVIMYHSVGIPDKNWIWNHLTCPYDVFENQIRCLKNRGFKSITLKQLYNYMKTGEKIPKKSFVLTFDDGYLDNWVFAYPILKKYGFKGTIYVNPEFVDSNPVIRENLEGYWEGIVKIDDLKISGYLSWDELKYMEEDGTMDIQSHSMTHTWYPISDKIIDFRHPDDSYIWMTWNNNPNKKPYLQKDSLKYMNLGAPVYEYRRSIGNRIYYPDGQLESHIIDYVQKEGGRKFFESSNWKSILFEITQHFNEKNGLMGKFETDKEYKERIYSELIKSKMIIEKELKKKVEFLCWPGGSVSKEALEIAFEVGYISSTVGRDIIDRKNLKNIYGEDPSRINRIGTSLYWNGVEGSKSKIRYQNGLFLLLSLYRFKESSLSPLAFLFLNLASAFYQLTM